MQNKNDNIIKTIAPVNGMSCAACSARVQKVASAIPGVSYASVDLVSKIISLEYDSNTTSLTEIKKAVDNAGYQLVLNETAIDEENQRKSELKQELKIKYKLWISVILSSIVFIISMFLKHTLAYSEWIMLILTTPVLMWSGNSFFIHAWKNTIRLTSNMDTLIALGTGSAYIFSLFNTLFPEIFVNNGMQPHVYYESASVVITLVLLGRFIEERAKRGVTNSIRALSSIQPATITVIRNNKETSIPSDGLMVGDVVIVKPGERIPADGIIISGYSNIDESMLTGESASVNKNNGDNVFAGTANIDGLIRIKALKQSGDTLLARIIKEVREAGLRKAPVQKLVDKISSVFVPVIVLVSIITFISWVIWGPEPGIYYAFLTAFPVLIIACPCALGLATPVAIAAGVGRGALNGILVKDISSLEKAYNINAIVFDKTGTLTTGKPEITGEHWFNIPNPDILNALYSMEANSSHPLASVIADYLKKQGATLVEITDYNIIPGKGVQAKYMDKTIYAGNFHINNQALLSSNIDIKEIENKLNMNGSTIVCLGDSKGFILALGLNDSIRKEAKETVQHLLDKGIEPWIVTGDNKESTERVANITGIKNYKANVNPLEKAEFIRQLKSEGRKVAMVGDGINDSVALTEADLSIALSSGTDIAMESSGITLFNPDIKQVASAIKLSSVTMKIIKQNLFWAFSYNIIAIPVAAGVLYPLNGFLLNPMIAGIAMALSSITVVLNSIRLRYIKI